MKKLNCILIIDNILEDRIFLENIFKEQDIEVLSCENTLEALELIEEHYKIELLIIDLNLEFLNGVDSIKLIKENFHNFFAESKLIVSYSSLNINKEDYEYFENEIEYKIKKPFSSENLINLIDSIFENKEFEIGNKKHFNKDTLMKRLGYNEELYLELTKESIEFISEYIENIKNYIENDDNNLIYRMAHKLKGISLNMSFEFMAYLAETIQDNSSDREICKKIVLHIEKEFELLKKNLNEGGILF